MTGLSWLMGEEEKLLDLLHQHGIAPSDLSLVVLTHGHTDHAGSVHAVARAGVPIAIGAYDSGLLERGVAADVRRRLDSIAPPN